jgi:hypothetical protein
MVDIRGDLYCTSKSICEALAINESTFREIYNVHRLEFGGLSVGNSDAKEFLQQNRVEFGIKRVRKDMHLWSDVDMLTFAFHAKSPAASCYRKQFIQFIKQHAKIESVSYEEFNQLRGELMEFKALAESALLAAPAVKEAASHAGSMLALQKRTKHLRMVT